MIARGERSIIVLHGERLHELIPVRTACETRVTYSLTHSQILYLRVQLLVLTSLGVNVACLTGYPTVWIGTSRPREIVSTIVHSASLE